MSHNKKRIAWIDDLKFLGIVCVILGHIIGFWNQDTAPYSEWVQAIIVSFNMPLFFMLSGYTFNKENQLIHLSIFFLMPIRYPNVYWFQCYFFL